MKSILDPSFKYTPSHATDIRKTFRKARREMNQTQGARVLIETDNLKAAQYWDPVLQCNVVQLTRKTK